MIDILSHYLNARATDKFFHDTLLYEGTMPLAPYEEVFDHKIKKMLTGRAHEDCQCSL